MEWRAKGGPIRCRLIVSWNPESKEYQYLLSNLNRVEFSPCAGNASQAGQGCQRRAKGVSDEPTPAERRAAMT